MAFLVNTYGIEPEMVLNSDQTGVPLTPCGNYQYAPTGSKEVTAPGYGDKRQITATPTTSAAGAMLPLQVRATPHCTQSPMCARIVLCHASQSSHSLHATQVIYQGTTDKSLPAAHLRAKQKFKGWHWAQTANHWSDLPTMKALVKRIIEPYRVAMAEQLGKDPATARLMWLIDVWSVHVGDPFRSHMKEEYPNILLLFVPPNCTSKFQPQDVGVQKPFKAGVQRAFREWQRRRYEKVLAEGALPSCHAAVLCGSCT